MKRNKVLRLILVLVGLGAALNSVGQQIPLIDHYYLNPFLSNPAMAGNNGNQVFLTHRSQWLDVEGAPETTVLTVDGQLPSEKIGLGVMAFRDQTNIFARSGFYGTYSYKLQVSDDAKLSFGLSLGFEQNRLLFNQVKADEPVEITLIESARNWDNFDAAFGANFNIENLNIGLAAYQLFGNNVDINDPGNFTTYHFSHWRHFLATASYVIPINDDFSVRPVAQVRFAMDIPVQFDATAVADYQGRFWLGAGYRDQFGLNMLAGARLADKFTAAYSYGASMGDVQRLSQNTHEIVFGMTLGGGGLSGNKGDDDKDGVENMRDIEPLTPHWVHLHLEEPDKDASECIVDEYGVAIDSDKDGIFDCVDKEVHSPRGAEVDEDGVALDDDRDGVANTYDREPETPFGCQVDKWGVALDGDNDGVPNCKDKELRSPPGAPVDQDGVAFDNDQDGVPDFYDLEPNTPKGCQVNERGIAKDGDEDGVPDCRDKEKNTPRGLGVDADGVARDFDKDGVPDQLDKEPDSPRGCKVDRWGRCIQVDPEAEDTDGDGVPNERDLQPDTPKGARVDEYGRAIVADGNPMERRVDLKDMKNNDPDWDYHVVVGVFRNYENVRNYQKHLANVYGENTKLLVTSENFYYVWTKVVTTRDEATEEINRLKAKNIEDYIVGNPWLWKEPKKK
jgi:type IX secretion system PorP/SprF family membrane protein